MNVYNNDNTDRDLTPGAGVPEPLPGPVNPELDSLLRQWHQVNAARAAAGRAKLLASITALGKDADSVQQGSAAREMDSPPNAEPKPVLRLNLPSLMEGLEMDSDDDQQIGRRRHAPAPPHSRPNVLRRIVMNRYSPLAAAMLLLASVMSYFVASNLNPGSRSGGNGRNHALAPLAAPEGDNTALIKQACFDRYVMSPDGGRLDAMDGRGNTLGPCILKHTDVEVNVAGFLNRVNIKQVYLNPHSEKIEAVYTFPLSDRAAVDRMTMTIGSRVIEGQVKERAQARQIYEQAKAQGRVASLLEQERPNIFTQSIANIEPAAEVVIEISYVEVLEQRDGQYSITFPTTIAPRYIPGDMMTWDRQARREPPSPPRPPSVDALPPEYVSRRGIVLIGPAQVVEMQPGDTSHGTLLAANFANELAHSRPVKQIRQPSNIAVWYNFVVKYEDGSREIGTLYTNGAGVVNGRAFFSPTLAGQAGVWPVPTVPQTIPPGAIKDGPDVRANPASQTPGDNFAAPTVQVPDADRITPMPVKPPMRAGQDISITVNIDTGGPAITNVKSQLHDIAVSSGVPDMFPAATMSRQTIRLKNQGEIPNRDFTLSWKVTGGIDSPMVLTHTAAQGNFFFVSVLPPERADDSIAVPREIMFVLDRSGSMAGFKIEQAKALIDATLATLRPFDTFNVLCFSDSSEKLWQAPRPATAENLAEARAFYGRSVGSGGTEMLKVIADALAPVPSAPPVPQPVAISPEALSNLPADGREVIVDVPNGRLVVDVPATVLVPADGPIEMPPPNAIPRYGNFPPGTAPMSASTVNATIRMGGGAPDIKVRMSSRLFAIKAPSIRLVGTWITENGDRILNVTQVDAGDVAESPMIRRGNPIRLVAFITDGEVGNDMEVLAAVKQYRGSARVFSFAIGNSPNRYLLDGMARLGRGEVDYVPLNADARDVIARFTRRVSTPVLTDIHATFSPNIQPVDVLTALGGGGGSGERVSDFEAIPDLYDQKPVVIVGRYNASGDGSLTITGNTASGPWSKIIRVTLPAAETKNSAIATLWARTKVESIMDSNLTGAQRDTMAAAPRSEIITLGESFNIVTQYTSFVAVDRLRVTVGGKPRLIQVPVDFPLGDEWSGYFGGGRQGRDDQWSDVDGDGMPDTRWYGAAAGSDGYALGFYNINSMAEDMLPPSGIVDYPTEWPSQHVSDLKTVTGDSATGLDSSVSLLNVDPSSPTAVLLEDARNGKVLYRKAGAVEHSAHGNDRSPPASGTPQLVLKTTTGGVDERLQFDKRMEPADPSTAGADAKKSEPGLDKSTQPAPRGGGDEAEKQRSVRGVDSKLAESKNKEGAEQSQPTRPAGAKPGEKAVADRESRPGTGGPAQRETPPPPPSAPAGGSAKSPVESATTRAKDESKNEPQKPKQDDAFRSKAPAEATKPAAQPVPVTPAPDAAGATPAGEASRLENERGRKSGDDHLRDEELDRVREQDRRDAGGREYDRIPRIDLQSLLQQTQGGGAGGSAPFRDDASEESRKVIDELNTLIYKRAAIVQNQVADGPRTSHDVRGTVESDKNVSAASAPALPARPIRREEIAMHIGAMAKKAMEDMNKPAAMPVVTKEPAPTTDSAKAVTPATPAAPVAPAVPPTVTDQNPTGKTEAPAATAPAVASEAPKPLDEAKKWTMAFYEVFKNYDVAEHMRDVFRDETLTDDAARAKKLVELGDRATGQLKNLIREAKLRRKLQPELVFFALASGFPETLGGAYDGAFPVGGIMIDSGLLVSLIVEKSDEAMLKKLADAGLRVESHDDQIKVVVGVVPMGRIAAVALVEGVRKMEMTKE